MSQSFVEQLLGSSTPLFEQLLLEPNDNDYLKNKYTGSLRQYVGNSSDGIVMNSEWRSGKREGRAYITFKDTTLINLHFVAGCLDGKQIIYMGDRRIDIQYDKELPTGSVKIYDSNSIRYDGNFVSGYASGIGTYYYDNSNRYYGYFLKGYASGDGRYYDANSVCKYHGQWMDGKGYSNSLVVVNLCIGFIQAYSPSSSPTPSISYYLPLYEQLYINKGNKMNWGEYTTKNAEMYANQQFIMAYEGINTRNGIDIYHRSKAAVSLMSKLLENWEIFTEMCHNFLKKKKNVMTKYNAKMMEIKKAQQDITRRREERERTMYEERERIENEKRKENEKRIREERKRIENEKRIREERERTMYEERKRIEKEKRIREERERTMYEERERIENEKRKENEKKIREERERKEKKEREKRIREERERIENEKRKIEERNVIQEDETTSEYDESEYDESEYDESEYDESESDDKTILRPKRGDLIRREKENIVHSYDRDLLNLPVIKDNKYIVVSKTNNKRNRSRKR